MIRFSGRLWNVSVTNGVSSTVVSQSVGGRTALTCTAASGLVRGHLPHGMGGVHKSGGGVAMSTDAVNAALVWDCWLAFPTLTGLASGSWTTIAWETLWDGAQTSTGIYLYLRVYYDGSAYHLHLVRVSGVTTETIDLGAVTQGTTFHRYTAWVLRDKIFHSTDGATPTEYACTGPVSTTTLYPDALWLEWQGGTCIPAWDACRVDIEEYDSGTTAGTSRTNGHQDNGTVFLVEKSALAGLISAGTAYALSITNGEFDASGVTADRDYLCCKVLSDNLGGFGVKLNKSAAGAVTPSNWSL